MAVADVVDRAVGSGTVAGLRLVDGADDGAAVLDVPDDVTEADGRVTEGVGGGFTGAE